LNDFLKKQNHTLDSVNSQDPKKHESTEEVITLGGNTPTEEEKVLEEVKEES